MDAGSDLGTIVRAQGQSFVRTHATTAVQRKALRAIGACRTPALGGHREQCDRCGYEHILWHSCRHRACPQCGGSARAAWLSRREAELLPVPYFHVVFTVPEELNAVAHAAPSAFYDLLFRAVGATLSEIGRSKLHVELGALCVLHTWTQTLLLHPHIHCVVPGGGFSEDGQRWRSVRNAKFFLPVKVLSRRFRTNLCSALDRASRTGMIPDVRPVLESIRAREWVVYCKPPFAGPQCVLRYLANYTHRIAISNARILAFDGERVTFRYRDSARGNIQRAMTLSSGEFLRRFLLHVLPSRFVRIRYYGFLANRTRTRSLERARALLTKPVILSASTVPATTATPCPVCHAGTMQRRELLSPVFPSTPYEDTS